MATFGAKRTLCTLSLLALHFAGVAIAPAHAAAPPGQSWGAIASLSGWYGYSVNNRSRAAAENAAQAQCERVAGAAGKCEVRTAFERSCGALATGNYGEWGTASAQNAAAASKTAAAQCNSHLPTEPCKVLVTACSVR